MSTLVVVVVVVVVVVDKSIGRNNTTEIDNKYTHQIESDA